MLGIERSNASGIKSVILRSLISNISVSARLLLLLLLVPQKCPTNRSCNTPLFYRIMLELRYSEGKWPHYNTFTIA